MADEEKKSEEKDESLEKVDPIDAIPVSSIAKGAIEKLPPDIQREIILMMSSHRQVGAAPNPIAGKISGEHIGKLIDYSEKDSERGFKDGISDRRYSLVYFVLSLGFLAFLIVFLSQVDKALLLDVLKVLVGFLGGLGLGAYGMSRKKKKDED